MQYSQQRGDREWQKFLDVGSELDLSGKSATRVNDATIATNKLSVSAETVSFAAGAAGTTGVVSLDKAPIYNLDGGKLGADGDTSFSWITGTVLTTEIIYNELTTDAIQLAAMSNGEYAIQYDIGRIRYKKATNGTSDTCNYSTRQLNVEITGPTDIEIGAVEIKDGSTDDRANVSDANTARAVTTHVLAVQEIGADGTVPPTGSLLTNAPFIKLTDATTNVDVLPLTSATVSTGLLSIAGEVVDFNTGAGDDPTPAIGILGESPVGAKALHIEIDDSPMDATPPFIPVGGEYRAAATVYTDGDATVLQTDVNGYLKISAIITEYTDDSTGFTVGASRGQAVMAIATSDTVDAGDVGAIRMTVNRNLGVDISEQSLTAIKVSKDVNANLVTNPIFTSISNGTVALDVLTQDSAFGTTSKGLAIFGKYEATPTAYTDGDAVPILLDANGRIVLSSDIEIGAVELKNAGTDDRAEIVAPNIKDFDFGLHTMPARYMATPPTLTDTFSTPLLTDSTGNLRVNSVADVPTTLTGGNKTVAFTGIAEALGASLVTKSIYIRAKATNTGNVYVGDSNVDAITSQQLILAANDSVTLNISNRSTVYVDVAVNGEGVDYLAFS